jgi:biopolymer transport protein ExbD
VLTMQRLAGIELKLPVADKGKPIDDTIAFIEALDTNSYAWHVGRETSPEYLTAAALGPKLEEYRRTYPVNRVLVRGSGKATFGATLRAVDEVRQAKISEVSIETTAK